MRSIALTLAFLIALLGIAGLLAWSDVTSSLGHEAAASLFEPTVLLPGPPIFAYQLHPGSGSVAPVPDRFPARTVKRALAQTTTFTLLTYPYAGCLRPPQVGQAGVPYRALNWDCLSAAGPPVSQKYTLLVLSNDYLTVTLLPELGGRVYELIFKPTGHNEFYRNPVLKPTRWGPPEQGWWLAAGGLEWGFPTPEHGYEWGTPWGYHVVTTTAGVTVTLSDSVAATRATLSVSVHLPADRAVLVIRPRIANPTAANVDVQYWTNAMLAPGHDNTPSADLRFLFLGDRVTVHSTGDGDLPPAGELMGWPTHSGRDYSWLGNWNRWLGFFEAPRAHGPFAGVYDTAADEGVLRVYPASVARGSKGFGFGWRDRLPSSLWTDDGSAYVEVHGGLTPTFWDFAALPPGHVVSWTELWYPLAGLGSVTAAGADAALRLERVDDTLLLGLYTPAAHEGLELYLWGGGCTDLGSWRLPQVDPAHPVLITLPAAGLTPDALTLVALSSDGALLGGVNPQDCLPPAATIESLPHFVTTTTFSVAWRGQDAWSGIARYDVQVRAGYEGAWTDWLTGTSALSATFTGVHGQTYFFRARAWDRAGNAGLYQSDAWGQAFTSVLLTPSPVLVTSRKLATPLRPTLGQPISYTILLSNTGNRTATSLVLTDHLPPTLVFVSRTLDLDLNSLPREPGDVITWHGSLPSGHEIRLTYALSATSGTPMGVPLTNTLRLIADGLAPLVRTAVIAYHHRVFLPLLLSQSIAP